MKSLNIKNKLLFGLSMFFIASSYTIAQLSIQTDLDNSKITIKTINLTTNWLENWTNIITLNATNNTQYPISITGKIQATDFCDLTWNCFSDLTGSTTIIAWWTGFRETSGTNDIRYGTWIAFAKDLCNLSWTKCISDITWSTITTIINWWSGFRQQTWNNIYYNSWRVWINTNNPIYWKLQINWDNSNAWGLAIQQLPNTSTRLYAKDDNFYINRMWEKLRWITINETGYIGINISWTNITAPLQVAGSVIFWAPGNTAGINSFVAWGINGTNAPYTPNHATGDYSTIWWWAGNHAIWDYSTIWWWLNNITTWKNSFIGWWLNNIISASSDSILGGSWNTILTRWPYSNIGWWEGNTIRSPNSTIWWWIYNIIMSVGSIIWWWSGNKIFFCGLAPACDEYNTIWWWLNNIISGANSIIWWWLNNKIYGFSSTIAWWQTNTANWHWATIAWWQTNTANWYWATIPWWTDNTATGSNSFAAWHRAKALHDWSFVRADFTNINFNSNGDNSFNIRAIWGVYIQTDILWLKWVQLTWWWTSRESLSDRNKKENIIPINTNKILQQFSNIPAFERSYIWSNIRYYWFMAQDYNKYFDIWNNNLRLSTQEVEWVLIWATKALIEKNNTLEQKVNTLEQRITELENLIKN